MVWRKASEPVKGDALYVQLTCDAEDNGYGLASIRHRVFFLKGTTVLPIILYKLLLLQVIYDRPTSGRLHKSGGVLNEDDVESPTTRSRRSWVGSLF